jgi:hypothetical protein
LIFLNGLLLSGLGIMTYLYRLESKKMQSDFLQAIKDLNELHNTAVTKASETEARLVELNLSVYELKSKLIGKRG